MLVGLCRLTGKMSQTQLLERLGLGPGPPWGSGVWELRLPRRRSTWLTCPTCSVNCGPSPGLPCSGGVQMPKGHPLAATAAQRRVRPLCGSDSGPVTAPWELRASFLLPAGGCRPAASVPLRERTNTIRKCESAEPAPSAAVSDRGRAAGRAEEETLRCSPPSSRGATGPSRRPSLGVPGAAAHG